MPRLDQVLVERGLCESREKAKRAIMAGQVRINQRPARKPSDAAGPGDQIQLLAEEKYVSRGGHKLEHALRHFHLNIEGTTAIDLGAATGGFTDCLLQHGASKVYALDVGRAQLAWNLRNDPRVVVMEQTNIRHVTRLPEPIQCVVIDVSFISLHLVLPQLAPLLVPGAWIVALVKPQFEAGKAEVDRGNGVITDPAVHERVTSELQTWIPAHTPLRVAGLTDSPIHGRDGNKEFLLSLFLR